MENSKCGCPDGSWQHGAKRPRLQGGRMPANNEEFIFQENGRGRAQGRGQEAWAMPTNVKGERGPTKRERAV